MRNILSTIAILLSMAVITSCQKDSNTTEPVKNTAYLGQNTPGMTPVRFGPSGYIASGSWWWQSSPAFSPDGKEMYFVKYIDTQEAHEIWFTKCVNDQWVTPQKAPFSTTTFEGSPVFSNSNDTLYFYSQRPGGFIFRVTRTATGWTEPAALNIPLPANTFGGQMFSIAKNGTIYFIIMRTTDGSFMDNYRTADIYKSRLVNGQYTQPENIGLNVNSDFGESVNFVDSDERFIIFASLRPGGQGYHDMYLSTKNLNGTWNNPVNLGNVLNTYHEDSGATITPDGKYFFYLTEKPGDRGYTPYWVDAGIITRLLSKK